ncbi:D-glycerate dehydrogenase [Candidatus Nephthysia bennettiae]|uniref:2-hydroxyacid dehydrogenase n=1 Tax=Candidatus Nephthysia bennettiae TaxID=3127016 RepID=UPI0030C70869
MTDGQRPRVLLVHPILDPGPKLLEEACEVVPYPEGQPLEEQGIRRAAEGCPGILSQVMDPIGEEVLSTPGLKVVSNVAVGYDNIDVEAATRHGVLVTNTPGVLTSTTADFAFALLMAAARRVADGDRYLRAGRFKGWAIDMMLGQDLHGATLGLVGVGRIGGAVARRARGFDMRILYSDSVALPPEVEIELGAKRVHLERLLEESDFVSLHVPLTPDTHHLISTEELGRMKSTAVLVNTSRGPVVDEEALATALREGQIFAAALDVFEHEPEVHPALLELDNVVLTPHIASASGRTRSEMCEMAVKDLIAGLRGERPQNLLNPEVLSR